MNYHILMTGATGLLGRYLLRDLLLADIPVAAVVRSSRRQSAEDRVESLMRSWEEILGRTLPRPHVLEGDISQSDLGLDVESKQWVERHCDAVLHNAASLSFVATSDDGEPYRSNIGGTQHVLDLCRATGIHDFYHVSTAYVAGLRTGRVFENEVDVGQKLSNPYEESKIAAEKMVRSADFLSPPTVFRPGIIIGDSETGFTTTFHGFYALLELAHRLVDSLGEEAISIAAKTRLSLDGKETKNLIPVDWVSSVITHVVTTPQCHGQTYHLTPRKPVTAQMICDVLEAMYGFRLANFVGHGTVIEDQSDIERLFYEHLRIYDSYWRDDPVFDTSNLEAACPHLPCPAVDDQLLTRLATKALEMDFKWRDRPIRRQEVAAT